MWTGEKERPLTRWREGPLVLFFFQTWVAHSRQEVVDRVVDSGRLSTHLSTCLPVYRVDSRHTTPQLGYSCTVGPGRLWRLGAGGGAG